MGHRLAGEVELRCTEMKGTSDDQDMVHLVAEGVRCRGKGKGSKERHRSQGNDARYLGEKRLSNNGEL